MALSLALHALAFTPLLLAGASGGASMEEPALLVEFSIVAPAAAPVESPQASDAPSLESAVESAEAPPPPEVPPMETSVELPKPEEPPPLDTADLKPVEPPKPPPPPSPPPPKPKPASTAQAAPAKAPAAQTAAAAPAGAAQGAQQVAAASAPLPIVWEGRPRFRSQPKPAAYPPRAVELGQQGEALVRVRLEPDGSAAEILLWRGTGFDLLDRAALAAVRGWQFLPAMRDGRAVAAWVEIPVRFHLR